MNTQRKRITLLLLAGMLGFSASCNTASDPNYAWLTGIANGTVTSTSSDPVPFSINVSDVTGDPAFMFDTTRTIPVFISVRDPISPLAGSLVQVLDMTNGATGAVIFQAVTNPDGTISGQFTINQTQQQVVILVTVNGQLLRIVVDISNVAEIRRFIFIEATVTPSIPIADRDGDGVADSQDAYPDDATRSSMVRIPGDSNYSIAYEDLYPVQGDADFNDYVVRVYNEEDLNAAGLVTRVRGSYTHIACGAGYKHRLMLQLPAGTGTYTLSVHNADGSLKGTTTGALASNTGIDLFNGLTSWDTLGSMANTKAGQTFVTGMTAKLEVVFTDPVPRAALTSAPYDLFLRVINTGKDIHFLGRYFNADGTDKYLDPKGFPWALLVPGNWKWPYERQNIHQSYQFFFDWYSTAGKISADWYNFPNLDLVYPAP